MEHFKLNLKMLIKDIFYYKNHTKNNLKKNNIDLIFF